MYYSMCAYTHIMRTAITYSTKIKFFGGYKPPACVRNNVHKIHNYKKLSKYSHITIFIRVPSYIVNQTREEVYRG